MDNTDKRDFTAKPDEKNLCLSIWSPALAGQAVSSVFQNNSFKLKN